MSETHEPAPSPDPNERDNQGADEENPQPGEPIPDKVPDNAQKDDASEAEQVEEPRTLEQQLAEAEARVLRVQAEMENFRKRTQRDQASERQYAGLPLARDLLVVIDNLDRALAVAEQSAEGQGLVEGVKMVSQQLVSVLAQHHCQKMDVAQEEFDPNLHEAVGQIPSDEFAAGTIIEVTQPGYRMHDRIVRAPQVLIAATPAQAGQETQTAEQDSDQEPVEDDQVSDE